MKIIYDPQTDILDLILCDGTIFESDEEKPGLTPGLILDYDQKGNVISIEVLDASKKLSAPIGVTFEIAASAIQKV